MLKKYTLIVFLLASVLMINPAYTQNSSMETITALETEIGLPHNGSILDRLNELETVAFGKQYKNESIEDRCARLKKNLLTKSETELDSELLKPINSSEFEKVVDDGLTCYGDTCGQQGVVEYLDGENKMEINSQKLIDKYGTTITKNSLLDLQGFLNNEGDIEFMNLSFVFNDSLDSNVIYLGEIKQVDYPGMDKTRAIYTFETQGGFEGDIFIRVYAKKGDQYILLKTITPLSTYNDDSRVAKIYNYLLKDWNIGGDPSENCSFLQSFKQKVQDNGKIQGTLSSLTQWLINRFAIKQ